MALQLSMNSTGATKPKASIGGYKGTAITAGDQSSIQAQMKAIDSKINTPVVQGNNAGILPKTIQHPTATTAVKEQKTPDGTVTKYYDTPKEPSNNTYGGLIGRGAEASQGAYNTGSQNYSQANQGLMDIANKGSDAYNKSVGNLTKFRESVADTRRGIYDAPTSARIMQGRDQAIQAANASKEAALAQEVSNALAGQGQQISAGSAALSGGLSSQGQGISGLGSAAGMMQPTSNIILRDPTTGAVIGDQNLDSLAATQGRLSGIQSGASASAGALGGSQAALTQVYQQGLAQLRAADNIEPQIVQTLTSNPNLNAIPISAITDLNRWFSGQTSQPEQQVLAKQVASYVAALGLSPDEAAQIASQQGGTIGSILKALKDISVAKNEANNPANINISSSSPSGKVQFNSDGTLKAVSF